MKSKFFFNVVNFFSDKEKIYIASKINLITLIIAILCIFLYFLNPEYTSRWLIIHSGAIISLGLSTYFLKNKRVSFAAWTSILVFWITLTYLTLTSGGVFSVIPYYYVFPILFSYLLLQSYVGLFVSLLSIATLIFLYFDPYEIVSESFKPKKIELLFTTSIFLMSTHFVILAIFSVVRINLHKLKEENRKKRFAERELKNLNRNLNNIFESIISVGIIVTDTKGTIKSFNKGAENIFGYKEKEISGVVNILSLLDEEELLHLNLDTKENKTSLFKKLCENLSHTQFRKEEWNFIRKDKSKCRIALTIVPLYSSNANIDSYLFTAIDITATFETQTIIEALNKELEEKVEERTQELQKANQSLLQMNFEMQKTLDELAKTQKHLIQKEKLAALGQLSAAVGHELNTPVGAIISSAYIQRDFMENTCLPTLEKVYELSEKDFSHFRTLLSKCKESFLLDAHLTRKEKREIKEILKTNPFIKVEDLELLYEINLDYSEVEVQELLRYENISHIIQILYFFCQVKKTNKVIELAAEKANTVLKSLRLYLSNPIDNKLEPIYLSKEIDIILTLHQNKIKQGIEVIKDFQAKEPFYSNKGSLNQVWINLLNNAIDAMNGKGTLKISSRMEDNYILVSFQDNGRGIPKEIQNKIFEPFFTTKKEGDGIGLGLYLCKKIIENLNGNISFQSETANTTFTVRIPLVEINNN